jgi:ribonuclease T2
MRTPNLTGLAVAACVFLPAACSQGEDAAYVLALSWQPAFCERQAAKPECRSQQDGRIDTRQWSLHGLWPQPGTRIYCGVEPATIEADKQGRWRELPAPRISEALWRRLQVAMPGTVSSLHRHEWIKHGTCMDGEIDNYYALSLDLVEAVNRSAVGRLAGERLGQHVSVEEIRAAFDRSFGRGAGERVRLACDQDGDRRLIAEITIGLAGKVGEGGDIAAAILAARPTDPGCPGGVIDEAGSQ